ncbi:phospholipase D-like domain-containing protein [Chelatococcus asaccharovorans]|uniref:Phospholipase D n=1 Tax=Chelatococcus asaccharovorans TaxID=28210 RepID=A0A2V3U3I4_9HYPH|nr:phospholipase D-like protein [Chelatococcus asaccharovorans]
MDDPELVDLILERAGNVRIILANTGEEDGAWDHRNAAARQRTFEERNVSIVRASRIDDRRLLGDFGMEQLTAKGHVGAIIHDKVMVIDPLSDDCTVVFGSHNLGFKASYANDENMVVVSGDRALAEPMPSISWM